MSEEIRTERRRLSPQTTVKDDMNALYGVADDAYAQLMKAVKNIQALTEQISKVVGEVKGLKVNGANLSAELTLLHDLTGALSTDMDTLTQAAEGSKGEIKETAKRQAEIMASVVETLMDVSDALESIKGAVIGLTQQLQSETPCPWRMEQGGDVFDALESLAALGPTIKAMADGFALLEPNISTVVEVVLTKDHRDPKTGRKKEKWDVFVEKVAESMAAAVISSIATGLLSLLVFLYFFGSKSAVAKAREEARTEQALQIETILKQRDDLEKRLATMQTQLDEATAAHQKRPRR